MGRVSTFPGLRLGDETSWCWPSLLAAMAGTLAGALVGGGTSVLLTRGRGGQSPADYGLAFFVCIAVASVLGLVGCYLALHAVGDQHILPTVAILTFLLPGAAWAVEPVMRTLARALHWTYGVAIPVAVVSYPLAVALSPIAARMIAGLFPESER
jgi:hypothetical protein